MYKLGLKLIPAFNNTNVGSCKQDNGLLVPYKAQNFLSSLVTISLSDTLAPGYVYFQEIWVSPANSNTAELHIHFILFTIETTFNRHSERR
jgi:hypothetical protein